MNIYLMHETKSFNRSKLASRSFFIEKTSSSDGK